MATITAFDHHSEAPGYPSVFCRADGEATGSIFDPPETPIWTLVGTLGDGTVLTWPSEHGDEAASHERAPAAPGGEGRERDGEEGEHGYCPGAADHLQG